ncbi:sulfurtransferase [Gammaproteobacteria bacterium AB-CW1]|uniref:Sulfurtransferase n=1 Tax=Natronospira elongata TaxID=3110268 RepID=A0AAP6MJY6_9GAMM|nr:sulfurtransferase [Gammaproteobacteria bacterium AB-CW1]
MKQLPMLIDAPSLDRLLRQDSPPLVIDCQAALSDHAAGRKAWLAGHIPGAGHADLESDLSGAKTAETGRHPLPIPEDFRRFLADVGLTPERPVVVYDDSGGAFAVRCWWLLRWFGHGQAALLDGGLSAWREHIDRLETGQSETDPSDYTGTPNQMPVVNADELQQGLEQDRLRLIDARGPVRFRGEEEPIDAVAGHIPGAVNLPFADNLDEQGRWKPVETLRERFVAALPPHEAGQAVHMCGSGVSACHNLFAMEYAGLKGSALYVGSWSEWIRDPSRPVARGE